MMDYRAGYYKLFGEITRALCALKRGRPEAAEKLLEQAQSSAELEYISALVLCGGQGASAGRERAAVCAHTQK